MPGMELESAICFACALTPGLSLWSQGLFILWLLLFIGEREI